MKFKLSIIHKVLSLVLVVFALGAPFASASTLHVYNYAGLNHAESIGRTIDTPPGAPYHNYYFQTFTTPSHDINVTLIMLPLARSYDSSNTPLGDLVVKIVACDAYGKPIDTTLVSSSISTSNFNYADGNVDVEAMQWKEIQINKVTLYASTKYAISCQLPESPAGYFVYWYYMQNYSGYADGSRYYTFAENLENPRSESAGSDYGFQLFELDYAYSPTMFDVNLVIGLIFSLGLGCVGFGMGKGQDATPALFLIVIGFLICWFIGWFPAWLVVAAIAVLAIFVAFKVKGAASGKSDGGE